MERPLRTLASNLILALLTAVLLSGCVGPRTALQMEATRTDSKIASLQVRLKGLGMNTDPDEARQAAETAVTYALRLAAEYRVATPARWHNLLIQMGFRDRGLCFHWTEDMMKHLMALNLKTFQLHWGVAHKGSDLREHNSVVITALNQPFENGLVLDPWRNAGDLYWAAVNQDSYPWEPLPPDQW